MQKIYKNYRKIIFKINLIPEIKKIRKISLKKIKMLLINVIIINKRVQKLIINKQIN